MIYYLTNYHYELFQMCRTIGQQCYSPAQHYDNNITLHSTAYGGGMC